MNRRASIEGLKNPFCWGGERLANRRNVITAGQYQAGLFLDVQNLTPGQSYHYRFRSNGVTSGQGTMKTLPVAGVEQVKLAVLSCSNYPAGYFHVYAEAAKQSDLDAVIHLGDYIYEYGTGGYASEDAQALGRTLAADNATEILVLDDYRKRYALYRGDADLQSLHAAAPFIAVWDEAGDPSVTAQERARVETVVPYNLDAWDGYAYEREVLLTAARSLNKNLVVLAGDTHNAWASDLATLDGTAVGVEFATASVTSPGLEQYLGVPLELIPQTEQAITTLVDDLAYLNASQRGYLLVTFTPTQAEAQWRFVDTIKRNEYRIDDARTKRLVTLPGAGNRRLVNTPA